jgi:hypothetical protein
MNTKTSALMRSGLRRASITCSLSGWGKTSASCIHGRDKPEMPMTHPFMSSMYRGWHPYVKATMGVRAPKIDPRLLQLHARLWSHPSCSSVSVRAISAMRLSTAVSASTVATEFSSMMTTYSQRASIHGDASSIHPSSPKTTPTARYGHRRRPKTGYLSEMYPKTGLSVQGIQLTLLMYEYWYGIRWNCSFRTK